MIRVYDEAGNAIETHEHRLGEDWLRAALYVIIFAALSLTGPGKFSLDYLLKRKKSPATKG